jgi:hypothetical protein
MRGLMRRLVVLFIVPAISSCAGQRVVATKSMEDQAKIEVLRVAKDPNSVEFGGPFAAGHRLNYTLLCGYVNWTNGFGGHVGWTLVGVMFPDNGNPPSFLPDALPAEIQCPVANANPPPPGISDELKRKHGIDTRDPLIVPSDYNLRKGR